MSLIPAPARHTLEPLQIQMTKRLIAGVLTAACVSFMVQAQSTAPGEVVLRAAAAPVHSGAWVVQADAGASGGAAMWLPDAGAPKLTTASAAPRDFFELTFQARAGVPYRLWFRSKAQNDAWTNDSAFVQFSGAVTSTGAPAFRVGTTAATVVSLEECNACGVSGWGWSDNGYGGDGPLIYFAADGTQTVRVQGREDGFIVDEIVLSPQKYLTSAPGAAKQDTTILPVSDGSSPAGVTLVRGPYLQQPAPRSMTIVWATRESGAAEVRYQTPTGTLSAPAVSRLVPNTSTLLGYDYYQYEAVLTGLAAATSYTYQPYVGGIAAAPQSSFRTPPAPGAGSISFVAFGDSGIGSSEQRQIGGLIGRENVDLALHTGDIVYGTSSTTGDATYATYQAWFFDIYAWLSRLPFAPAEGNHDSRPTNGDGRAYLDLFSLPTNGAIPERYYSFDEGPVHFIVLDTEYAFQDTTRRAAQLSWIESDLSATRQPWKIAVFHRSPYSSGTEHGSDLTVRAAFGPLFERYGVDLALSGHDHGYERTIPIRESTSTSDRPVTYVVTGGGGAALYPVGTSTWTAYSASRYEYVRGRADNCTLTLEAIGLDGAAFDGTSLSHCSTTASEVVLYAGQASRAGAWVAQADASAAGGTFVIHPDAGAAKITTAAAAPANYVEMTFNAVAGVPYRLWLRSRAQNDYYGNDSVFVQFSGSVDSGGSAMWRIGTTDATVVVLEDCGGCGEQGWGWQDNGYGLNALGPLVYFATTGQQRVRIQTREDGLGIDQIVLSPGRYLSSSPGALKNDTTILAPGGGQ
jgi:hypothetical protein